MIFKRSLLFLDPMQLYSNLSNIIQYTLFYIKLFQYCEKKIFFVTLFLAQSKNIICIQTMLKYFPRELILYTVGVADISNYCT